MAMDTTFAPTLDADELWAARLGCPAVRAAADMLGTPITGKAPRLATANQVLPGGNRPRLATVYTWGGADLVVDRDNQVIAIEAAGIAVHAITTGHLPLLPEPITLPSLAPGYRAELDAINNGTRQLTLEDYVRLGVHDRNFPYRIDHGHIDNLLDDAIDQLHTLQQGIRALAGDVDPGTRARLLALLGSA